MNSKHFSRVMAVVLSVIMLVGVVPFAAFATIANWATENVVFDGATFGTNGYYNVISKKDYVLVPGAATETEMVINNSEGNRRQVLHIIEVDPSNPDVSVLPGYYGIDKFMEDPTNTANQKAAGVTAVAQYYDTTLGYQVVGAMNTGLSYDCNAPYSFLVYNGQVLVDKNNGINDHHSGVCKTILCVYKDAETGECYCELRTNTQGLRGDEWQAIGANFAMTVNNGKLVSKTEERTSEMAARSMVGVKEDGTLVLVMNDGRNANNSKGFNNYELGESMLALGCKWAFNCDGGGSSSIVTRRAGEDDLVCRCVPCDGAERPTLNSVIIVSNVAPTGILDSVNIDADYDYFAPGTTYTFGAAAIDTHGYAMDMPVDAVWTLSDPAFGTIENGTFVSNGTLGDVDVQVEVGGAVVGSKTITVANPTTLGFTQSSTVLPYGKSTTLAFTSLIGEFPVFLDGSSFNFALSNAAAGTLDGLTFTATTDESIASTTVTATYVPTGAAYTYTITFGKGSEIVWDFEDNDLHGFLGQQDAYDWQLAHGVETPFGTAADANTHNTLIGRGQISTDVSSTAFISSVENGGKVHNGNYALGYTFDMTQVAFNSWTYDVMYNVSNVNGDVVFRDVANGKKATTFGCWVYVPYGFYTATNSGALALQANLFGGATKETAKQIGLNMQYNGKNLNALTEADIPENRWVYCVANISGYNYVSLVDPLQMDYRSPSIMRMYIKPSNAQVLTYYFDEFTLDYSSAVDDRVPPVISDPQYAPNDANIAFADGVVLTEPSAGFTAYVSDANSGIDASTAAIYIDGNKIDTTKVTGNMIHCDAVSLGTGTHKVKFEIADKLGNYTTLTRTIVSSTENHNMQYRTRIELGGHNDSGETPMPGSTYYIDVSNSYSEPLGTATFTLSLNTANEWILEGLEAVDGYEVTYTVNPVNPNEVTFTVTSGKGNGSSKVMFSVPVRVYNPLIENGFSDGSATTVSGRLITAPLSVELTSCLVAGSYGNYDYYCVEALNAHKTTVRHEHTITDVADVDPTCTEIGISGRTYCSVCQSIVDFGTKIPATGHSYELVGDKFVCSVCQGELELGTGLIEIGGKTYYAIGGTLQTGWQLVDEDYYYFGEDYAGVSGTVRLNNLDYEFDSTGKLEHGVWTNAYVAGKIVGKRYYFGPSYYHAQMNSNVWWADIDGVTYGFSKNGVMYSGIALLRESRITPSELHEFTEEGAYIGKLDYTGFYEYDGTTYYFVDGAITYYGIIEIDGDYYFIAKDGTKVTGSYYVSAETANGLIPAGTYLFKEDGKLAMMSEADIEIRDGVYYVDGAPLARGLVEYEGDIYYAGANGVIATDVVIVSESKTNGILDAGLYLFDADGKLANGVIDGWYYLNGQKQPGANLVKNGDDYYFVKANGTVFVGTKTITDENSNGLLEAGSYIFGADGKMTGSIAPVDPGNPEPVEEVVTIVDGVYYVNGVPTAKGLIVYEGDIYYAGANGAFATGVVVVSASKANGILDAGVYTFDADGKLANGVIDGWYYLNGVKLSGANLVKNGDDYYFVKANGKVFVGTKAITDENSNGLLEAGSYIFGADGKMTGSIAPVDPGNPEPVEEVVTVVDGVYYVNGVPTAKGLIVYEGDIYYAGANGVFATDVVVVSAGKANGILDAGVYTFDADGKLANGAINGWYYLNGQKQPGANLVQNGDDYYFVKANGKVFVGNKTITDENSNGLLEAGVYVFGADGKMIQD